MSYRTRILTALVAAAAAAAAVPALAQATPPALYAISTASAPPAITTFLVGADGTLTDAADLSTGTDTPTDLAFAPDGRTAYMAFDSVAGGGVEMLQVRPDGALDHGTRIAAGSSANAVAVSPDGRFLYLGDTDATIRTFAIGTDGQLTAVGAPVAAGDQVVDVVVSPDGAHLYATTTDWDGTVSVFAIGADGQPSGRTTTPIPGFATPGNLTITAPPLRLIVEDISQSNATAFAIGADGSLSSAVGLPNGGFSGGPVAASPVGPFSFVTGSGRGWTIKTYDTTTLTEAASLPLAGQVPDGGVAVSADGGTVYVRDNTAHTIRTFAVDDAGVLAEIGAGVSVSLTSYLIGGIVLRPDQPPVATFTAEPSGKTVALDASGSTDPEGDDIDRYDWDFGDGTTLPDGGPITAHDYADYGTYTVTVTETDALGCSTQRTYTGTTVGCNGGPGATATRTVTISPPFVPLPPAPPAPVTSPSTGVPPAPGPRVLPVIDGRGQGPVRATRRGRVTLPELTAVCTTGAGPCDDSSVAVNTTIRGREVTLGTAAFRLADGADARISLRLSRRGRALLAAHRSLEVNAVVTLRNAASAAQATRTVSLTLLAPRRR